MRTACRRAIAARSPCAEPISRRPHDSCCGTGAFFETRRTLMLYNTFTRRVKAIILCPDKVLHVATRLEANGADPHPFFKPPYWPVAFRRAIDFTTKGRFGDAESTRARNCGRHPGAGLIPRPRQASVDCECAVLFSSCGSSSSTRFSRSRRRSAKPLRRADLRNGARRLCIRLPRDARNRDPHRRVLSVH